LTIVSVAVVVPSSAPVAVFDALSSVRVKVLFSSPIWSSRPAGSLMGILAVVVLAGTVNMPLPAPGEPV